MVAPAFMPQPDVDPALAELARLRRFTGPPGEFWPACVAALSGLTGAARGVLVLRESGPGGVLRKLSEWSASGLTDRDTVAFQRSLPQVVEFALRDGQARLALETVTATARHFAVGVSLQFQGGQEQCAAVLLLTGVSDAYAAEALVRLRLAADLPLAYQTNAAILQTRHDVEKFASVLDVMVLVNAQTRFRAAALAFCNGLAERFRCERVSLGWLESGFARLAAISRTERFDPRMAAVKAIEVLMEEALDQDEEVVWPAPTGEGPITRDHQQFAREQDAGHLVSLPLRLDGKVLAALACERRAAPFAQVEVQQLRLACDQASRRLADLKRTDRWFGARWAAAAREKLSAWIGPEHTWAKVAAALGALLLVVSLLPVFPFRVEGNFVLRSDELAYLTAPFDGYIQSVAVRPGDLLKRESILLHLNTDQLELEEAAALADQTRYLREVEKARATSAQTETLRSVDWQTEKTRASGALAEMRIAQALADQAKARLDLARYRLGQANLRAPFDGVLVEGDLRQRLGAPVKQGDALFKVARIDALYVEAEIKERDVDEILGKSSGEVAFVAQPKAKWPVKVLRVEPAAVPKEKDNVFLARCGFTGSVQPWWRPGLSGICKVNVDRRSLLWLISHRTVDFLRMLLWW